MRRKSIQYLGILCLLWALATPVFAQLDTLLYEEFDDNRLNWPLYSDIDGSLEIEDGYMKITRRQRKGSYQFRAYRLSQPARQDQFTFEARINPIESQGFGIVFNVRRNKKQKPISYTGVFVGPKAIFCYTYQFADGYFVNHWNIKVEGQNKMAHTFRVEPADGRFQIWMDDQLLGTWRPFKSTLLKEWGVLLKGYNIIEVDYLRVFGTYEDSPSR